jgi:uncharacterized protein (DUF427 family)
VKATWNGVTIADSDRTVLVETNQYFPLESVDHEHLKRTWMKTLCPWNGIASYYTVVAGDQVNVNAVWTHRLPYPWIRKIRDHVAFWQGVEVHR